MKAMQISFRNAAITLFLILPLFQVSACPDPGPYKPVFWISHAMNDSIDQIHLQVDSIFQNYSNEIFFESIDLTEESGWTMELPSGGSVTRSFLMCQADHVIALGIDATPHLFKWVMNEQLYIRYIAIYALQQLTGIEPYTPYFDEEDPEGNLEKAIAIWSSWYKNQKQQ